MLRKIWNFRWPALMLLPGIFGAAGAAVEFGTWACIYVAAAWFTGAIFAIELGTALDRQQRREMAESLEQLDDAWHTGGEGKKP